MRAMKYSRAAMVNLRHSADYLLASQCARLILMIAGVFSPVGIFTPVQLLVWGLLMDFIAVLAISFQRPSSYVLSVRPDEMGLYTRISQAVQPAVCGAVWAVVSALPVVLTMIITGVGAGDISVFSGVYAAALLCIPPVEHYFMTGHSLFRRRSGAKFRFLLTLAAAAAAAVVCAAITGTSMFSGKPVNIALRALSMILPAAVLLATGEIVKVIKNKNR